MMLPSMAIIRRDLLRAARQKRTFVWVVALVGITSLFVVAFWPDQAFYYYRGSRVSQDIVFPSIMTWMFAVMLLVTPYAATTIVLERQRETFDLVRTTRIRPLGFVFAQLFSVLALQLVLILTTLPVVASVYFLVGLELRNLIVAVGMVVVVMVSCAVAGLYASSKSQSVLTALVRAYLYAFTVMGGPVIVGALILEVFRLYRLRGSVEEVFAVASPAFAGIASAVGEVEIFYVIASALIQSVVIVLGLGLTYSNVRRPERETNDLWTSALSRLRRPFGRTPGPGAPAIRRQRPIGEYANPVYVKDTRFVGRGHRSLLFGLNLMLFVVAALIAAPAFFISVGGSEGNREEALVTWVVFMWFALGILAPLMTATSIANEDELGNLDMLRVTRIRAREVVLGKFLAGCRLLFPALVVLAALSLVLAPLDYHPRMPGGLTTGFVSACLAGLLGLSMGILASAFARTSTRAAIWAFFLTAWMLILMFLAGALSYEMLRELHLAPGRNHALSKAACETVMFLSPPLAWIRNWDDHGQAPTLVTPYWLANTAFHVVFNGVLVLAACMKLTARWPANRR